MEKTDELNPVSVQLDLNSLMRRTQVLTALNIGKTKFAELLAAGLFPAPIRLINGQRIPGRTLYWKRGDVLKYLLAQDQSRSDDLKRVASEGLNRYLTGSAPVDCGSHGTEAHHA